VLETGLIPFWTKRSPDYGSVMKTINCRDDSLLEDRGMWTSMKKKKRCIIVAQGFYEWLKKNNGREKIPHYTVRKDRQLMCFAGLWDCVQYEGEYGVLLRCIGRAWYEPSACRGYALSQPAILHNDHVARAPFPGSRLRTTLCLPLGGHTHVAEVCSLASRLLHLVVVVDLSARPN
jgi:hypothetical protein